MKKVRLGGKNYVDQPLKPRYTLIDDEDYEEVSKYFWHRDAQGYVVSAISFKNIRLHRFIMDAPKGSMLDHIDGNRLNNTKGNLRYVTCSQNCMNQRKSRGGTSKYKGVYIGWNKHRWYAAVRKNGKQNYLGSFKTEENAALAYNKVALELFGEHACLNHIEKRRKE